MHTARGTAIRHGSIYDVLQERLRLPALPPDPAPPFDLCGGYVGYFGYEFKGELGLRNRHCARTPDAVWIAATRYLVVDHAERRLWAVALCRSSPDDTAAADRWIAATPAQAMASQHAPAGSTAPVRPWVTNEKPAEALARPETGCLADIEESKRLLRQGESYESCLTNRVTLPFESEPLDLISPAASS